MPVRFHTFTDTLNQWLASQPEEVKRALPPSSWKPLSRTGRDVGGGTVFDAQEILETVLGGDRKLFDAVAVPVADLLTDTFGAKVGSAASRNSLTRPGSSSLSVRDEQPRTVGDASRVRGRAALAGARPDRPPVPPSPPAETGSEEPSRAEAEAPAWVFPRYDYSRADLDVTDGSGTHIEVTATMTDEGRLHYSWPDAGQNEIYRVVISDDSMLYDPDGGIEVAVTEGLECWDDEPRSTALRFVTVWGYNLLSGSTVLGQCRLVASNVVVHPLEDWEVVFDASSRTVQGRWKPPVAPENAQVEVLTARFPHGQHPAKLMRGAVWLRYLFANNGAGFQDPEVIGGVKHHYVAAVQVTLDGETYLSLRQRAEVVVDVLVEPVTDLEVAHGESRSGTTAESLEITWTEMPGTSVEIYMTKDAPTPGAIERGTIPASQLAQAGMTSASRVTAPPGIEKIDVPGRHRRRITGVPWPDDKTWDEFYITPVVRHADEATFGPPARLKRARDVSNTVLVRRRGRDLVTLTWPGDAPSIEVRLVLDGATPDPEAAPVLTVKQDEYQHDGGIVLSPNLLPPEGGRVVLSAVEYLEGKLIHSEPVEIEAPPLWVYRYTLQWPGSAYGGGRIMRKLANVVGQTYVSIEVEAVHGVTVPQDAIGMALIHNPRRMPLHANDGERVPLYLERPTSDGGQEAYPAVLIPAADTTLHLWFDHAPLSSGFVRLMMDSVPKASIDPELQRLALEHYVLLDPDIDSLRKP